MKKAISIPELLSGETKEGKGIEFTHYLNADMALEKTSYIPSNFKTVVYLGKCRTDGDMFCAIDNYNDIRIFKGHLNNGTY